LNTNEVKNNVLTYDEKNLTDKLFTESQKSVQNLNTIQVLFDSLKSIDYRWYYKKIARFKFKHKKWERWSDEEFRKMTRFKFRLKKWRIGEANEVKFNIRIRLKFDKGKTKFKMEIDNFNKFIVNTHTWRSNGFRNLRRWRDSLWDYFGWWGKTKFDLWENISPIFAVINSNLSLDDYNIFCNDGNIQVFLYEIPKFIGYWNQAHLCFGLDQVGVLKNWPSFTIYCSDMLPSNDEFVFLKSMMVVPMLRLDERRCFFVEEEQFKKCNSRFVAIRGNVYMMQKDLMDMCRRMLIKNYKIQSLIFRFPRKIERLLDKRHVEVCP
jgi:hypothetical protein